MFASRILGWPRVFPGRLIIMSGHGRKWCIEMDKEIKITQVRSTIGRLPAHRRTVRALGLHRIGHTVVKKDSPAIRGMINTVNYLLKVEE